MLQWCEARPECHRLKLTDYLAKPMQRLTKYPLLLKQIVKAIDDQQQKERMEAIVSQDHFYNSVCTLNRLPFRCYSY